MSAKESSTPNRLLQDPTGTITPHIFLVIAQLFALSMPHFRGRRTIAATCIIGLAISSQLNSPFTQDLSAAQPWSLMWPNYLSTLDKILCSGAMGPEHSFWCRDRPAKEASRFSPFSPAKLKWAAAMIINLRGIGWNYEVKNIPKQPVLKKRDFLTSQSVAFLRLLFMTDVLLQLASHLFLTSADGELGALNTKSATLRHPDIFWNFVKALVFGAGPYFFMRLQHTACSIIAVAIGLAEPKDWPPYFGQLRDVTTVREFWGRFWHQSIRKFITSFTGACVDMLHIKRGTNLSSYFQLWLAFFTSGCMHAASMMMLPAPVNITWQERTLGMLQFFLWQAAAITFEDFVQWTLRGRWETSRRWRLLRPWIGYVWVTCSMWYSLPFAGDVMLRIRLQEKSFLPFTLVGPWIKSHVPIP